MSSNSQQESKPFVLTQLEEALEERQGERRQKDKPLDEGAEDRRKGDRRQTHH